MKNIFLLCLLSFCTFYTINAQSGWVGISTGSQSGTYHPIGEDMANIAMNSMNLKVHTSTGSIQNIERILREKAYQYAIVQHDALSWYEHNVDKGLRKKINFIFPLYDEEVHILVNKKAGIKSITDLRNKRVNIGREKSGSWVTARLIKQLTGLIWQETYESPRNALQDLLRGNIDAMIYVVGKPAKIFEKDLPPDAGDYIELLSCSHPNLDGVYLKTQISQNDYSWQRTTVNAYTTKAILVTYNYRCDSSIPRFRNAAENICKLIYQINLNLDDLRRTGHPKWREIKPELSGINWPVHPKAEEAIRQYKCTDCGSESDLVPVPASAHCLVCGMQIDNARNLFVQGDYCAAVDIYKKIFSNNCSSCPGVNGDDLSRDMETCKSKARCN